MKVFLIRNIHIVRLNRIIKLFLLIKVIIIRHRRENIKLITPYQKQKYVFRVSENTIFDSWGAKMDQTIGTFSVRGLMSTF